MRDVTAAEWRKAWTGHAWWLLAAFGVFLSLLASVGFATQAEQQLADRQTDLPAVTDELVRSWFMLLLFSALFGAVLVTKEFGSGAISRSVLLSGGRDRLFAAKLLVGTAMGLLYGVLAAALAAATPFLFLPGIGQEPEWSGDTTLTLLGVFAVTVLGAPWGVLIGWLLRNQVAAVGALLGLTLLVDESLLRLAPDIGRFTMTIAMSSVYRDGKPELLPVPVALAVIGAWLLLAGFVSRRLLVTRDVR